MPLQLHWFIPSHGDGREVSRSGTGGAAGSATGIRRAPDIDYLLEVALAAERAGFTGALTPTGLFCEDAWVVASALAMRTSTLKFMIALRPGSMSPMVAAQMAATLQRVSGGRLLLNVVTGGDRDEQRRYGDHLPHDQRYQRTGEFLQILRTAWRGDPFDFTGRHHEITAGLLTRTTPQPPTLFVGGSSPAARAVAAAQSDVYLAWGEPPDGLRELLASVRAQADAAQRSIGYGSRFHVITRDTAAEAWAVAQRLVDGMDPALIRAAQERFARSESVGQRRMAALHGGRSAGLEVHPNIWAGYGLARPGAGLALVGSHEDVAERIEELYALGCEHLILSGQPHLEEAYWFGEGVMPLLRKRGVLDDASRQVA